jgi:predicted phosphodiesterase
MDMAKTRSTLVIPDIQYPYHDAVILDKILKVVRTHQPDQIVQIGDGIDFDTLSQWAKGTKLEFADTLQEHIDGYRREVLAPLREAAPQARIIWIEGNHDLRLRDFVRKYAAPLATLRALKVESLFGLVDLDISYERGPLRVATNTLVVHGHESGGYCASASAWDAKFAKRYGSEKNVIFGHTHQPFLITRAFGYKGKVSPRFTMNVGSIANPADVTYVKDGSVSWQQSFAWLEDDGKRVWPELVTLVDRLGYFKGGRI